MVRGAIRIWTHVVWPYVGTFAVLVTHVVCPYVNAFAVLVRETLFVEYHFSSISVYVVNACVCL